MRAADIVKENIFLIIALISAVDILFIILFLKLNSKIRKIFKNESMDIEEVLLDLRKHEKFSTGELENLGKRMGFLECELPNSIRKIGIVRYNPFSGAGGDQSFALALLDDHKNGLVLSSIYGREMNRVYAKKIEGGECKKHQLTEEEKQVINEAVAP